MEAAFLVLLSVVLSVVKGLNVNCVFNNFQYWNSKEYTCTVKDLKIVQPFTNITSVTGEYKPNYDSKDVKGFQVIDQNTNYLPYRFDVFPNLSFLWVQNSNQKYLLKTDFTNLPKLEHIHFHEGEIAEIDEDTFVNTPELWYIAISHHKIKSLPKCLFRKLTKLKHVSFHDNQLEVIDGDLFKNNPMVDVIRFNDNHLQIIGLDLLHNLKFLEIVWFQHNLCIDMETDDDEIYEIEDHYRKACFNETFENESKLKHCKEPQSKYYHTDSPFDTWENGKIVLIVLITLLVFVTVATLIMYKRVSNLFYFTNMISIT